MKNTLILIYTIYNTIKTHLIKIYINVKSLFFSKLFYKCGILLRINGKCKIYGFSKIEIGNNVHLGNNLYVNADGGLIIKDNTHISRNVVINTSNHNYKGKLLPYDEELIFKKVIIGKNVWIGMNVTIAPGTNIGDGAIIGSGTSIAGKIPKLAIIGNSTKILKYRNKSHYNTLENNKQYGGISGKKL